MPKNSTVLRASTERSCRPNTSNEIYMYNANSVHRKCGERLGFTQHAQSLVPMSVIVARADLSPRVSCSQVSSVINIAESMWQW